MEILRAALMAPEHPQQKIFVVNGRSTRTHQHQFIHVNSGRSDGTHIHIGQNPDTTSAFVSLTDAGHKVPGGYMNFTSHSPVAIGEYETWAVGENHYAQLGVFNATNSIVWSSTANVMTAMGSATTPGGSIITASRFGPESWFEDTASAMGSFQLPGSRGLIYFTPDVTVPHTHWQYQVAVPFSATTTAGPGILFIAWVLTCEVFGQPIHRPDRPRRVAGEERIKGQYRETNSTWVHVPQGIFGLSRQRQIEA